MKLRIIALAFTPALLFADSNAAKPVERIQDSTRVLREIMSAPDKSIPQNILAKAQCVGIVPGVKRAGYIVGGKYGKGIMTCRTASGWSGPSTIVIEGGSIGLQIGAGETDVVLVVQNKAGEEKLMKDKFTLGADAAAMAGPVGRTATAETDAEMRADILSYSRSRGLFAGVDLGGATLRPDNKANKEVYGRAVTQREILDGKVAPPSAARPLFAELHRYAVAPVHSAKR